MCCGIVGYLGNRNAQLILIDGLKKLEYRGYDSAGIALIDKKSYCKIIKTKGKVSDLEKKINFFKYNIKSNIGIGHTRWATHGEPNDINAHPHISNSGNLIIIHNGIIENYNYLKNILINNKFFFKSETDTEILVNFIEFIKNKKKLSLYEGVRYALNKVIGTYSIILMDINNINEVIVAKLGSPIAIGIGVNNSEFFIASDHYTFIKYTKNVIYLEDGELANIHLKRKIYLHKISDNIKIKPKIYKINDNIEIIEKKNYDFFMLKEIYEQPISVLNTINGRLLIDKNFICMSGIYKYKDLFIKTKRIIIIACGTSWHSGLIGEYLFENFARLPVEVEYASEFIYRNPVISSKDIVIAISQSGETADTLSAVKLAKKKGAFVFGICNVIGSSIARITNAGAYTHAGIEIGVASTKGFTSQIVILILMSLEIGRYKGKIKIDVYKYLCKELQLLYKKMKETLKTNLLIRKISKIYKNSSNFLYLGRGLGFPIALEGALKLKEISYIHAEGYPAAEMKHGPIALIDENMPVVVIATKGGCYYKKIINNIQEIKSRKGKIIAIINKGDIYVRELADHVIEIPNIPEELSPIITIIPLQLLAYHIALMRGKNVDQPRNLAKSVTVE